MAVVDGFIGTLEAPIVQEYVLPLLLVFVILYGVLESISVFKNNRIDAVIAIIGSLLLVTYQPFVQGTFQQYAVNMFGSIAMLLLGILAFLMLTGLIFGQSIQSQLLGGDNEWIKWGIVIGAAIAVFLMFLSYGGSQMLGVGLDYVSEDMLWQGFWAALLLVIVGALVFGGGNYKWEVVDESTNSGTGEIHDSYSEARKDANSRSGNYTVRKV